MRLAIQKEEEYKKIMLCNIATIKQFRHLNKFFKHEILNSSFWNPFLRFIEINEIEYPTNSIVADENSCEILNNFVNPFINNCRVSYNKESKELDFEKKEIFVDDLTKNSKKEEWVKFKKSIPIGDIKNIKIFSLNVKNKNIDYTVYKLIIKTKNL